MLQKMIFCVILLTTVNADETDSTKTNTTKFGNLTTNNNTYLQTPKSTTFGNLIKVNTMIGNLTTKKTTTLGNLLKPNNTMLDNLPTPKNSAFGDSPRMKNTTFGKLNINNSSKSKNITSHNKTTTGNATKGNKSVAFTPPKERYVLLRELLFSLILVLSIIGNLLLLSSIVFVKRLRQMKCNYLIFHLALSDIIMTLFSAPFSLSQLESGSGIFYPFEEWACKSVWPIATYATNCSALTLTCIAVERYLAINSICVRREKLMIFMMIVLVQLVSIGSVIPYVLTLRYINFGGGIAFCYENWDKSKEQKAYTVVLFTLQYALPIVCITLFYSMTWHKIMKRNKRMIRVSEEYERKINTSDSGNSITRKPESSRSSTSTSSNDRLLPPSYDEATGNSNISTFIGESSPRIENNNNNNYFQQQQNKKKASVVTLKTSSRMTRRRSTVVTNTLARIRSARIIRKPRFISQTAYVRHRQTLRTLKMFTTIVVLFTVFALPNQIVWLMADFDKNRQVPLVLVHAFVFFTYTNAVANCWVYGFFNKHFRKAYKELLVKILPCLKYCCHIVHQEYHSAYGNSTRTRALSSVSMTASTPRGQFTTDHDDKEFEDRQLAFTQMFEDHLNNFEKYEHLYNKEDDDDENVDDKKDNNAQSLLSPPQAPPAPKRRITLASLASVVFTPSASRKTSRVRDSSATLLDNKNDLDLLIDTDDLIPIEQLKVKTRRAKSASDLRMHPLSSNGNNTDKKNSRSRSIWSMISPLQARKKSSTNAPVQITTSTTMPDIKSLGVQHNSDTNSACVSPRGDDENEQMVFPIEIKVQESKQCGQSVAVVNLQRESTNNSSKAAISTRKQKTISLSPPIKASKKIHQQPYRKLSLGSNIKQKQFNPPAVDDAPTFTYSPTPCSTASNDVVKEPVSDGMSHFFDNNFAAVDHLEQQHNAYKKDFTEQGDVSRPTKCNNNESEKNPSLQLDSQEGRGATIVNDNSNDTLDHEEDQSTQKLIQKLEKLNQAVYESQTLSDDQDFALEPSLETPADIIDVDRELIQKLEKLNQVISESRSLGAGRHTESDTLETVVNLTNEELVAPHSNTITMMDTMVSHDLGYASFKDVNLIDCNESNV